VTLKAKLASSAFGKLIGAKSQDDKYPRSKRNPQGASFAAEGGLIFSMKHNYVMLFKLTRLSTCISCLLVKMNVLNFQSFFIYPVLCVNSGGHTPFWHFFSFYKVQA
jgi:hypothetical protein